MKHIMITAVSAAKRALGQGMKAHTANASGEPEIVILLSFVSTSALNFDSPLSGAATLEVVPA